MAKSAHIEEIDQGHLRQIIGNLGESVKKELDCLTDEIKKYTYDGQQEVIKSVTEHPMKSLGLATAAGFVIGYLCHNNKKH